MTSDQSAKNPPGPLTRKATGLMDSSLPGKDEKLLEDALAQKYGTNK
jgi:hypothetical protein